MLKLSDETSKSKKLLDDERTLLIETCLKEQKHITKTHINDIFSEALKEKGL